MNKTTQRVLTNGAAIIENQKATVRWLWVGIIANAIGAVANIISFFFQP